jgi:hypothetical protein
VEVVEEEGVVVVVVIVVIVFHEITQDIILGCCLDATTW